MPGFLGLIAAMLLLEMAASAQVPPVSGMWGMLGWWLGGCAAYVVIGQIFSMIACWCARRHGACNGLRRVVSIWDIAGQMAIIGAFAWFCYMGGWVSVSGTYCLGLLPWVLAMVVHWWVLAGGLRVLGDHWTRMGFTWQQMRIGILPVAIILPLLDGGTYLVNHTSLQDFFTGTQGVVLNLIGGLAAGAGLMVLGPWLLIRIWGARPFPPGPGRDLIDACCQQTGVRVRGIMAWPTPGGRSYNAVALGVLPRLRWVLVTEDLLRECPHDQVAAVIGHELGHHRYGHVPLYFFFLILIGGLSIQLAAWLSPFLFPELLPAGMGIALTSLVVVLLAIRGLFGPVSRACERQADLVGAACAGKGDVAAGAPAMAGALRSVALLAGQPEDAPCWRHRSIAARTAYLESVAADPTLASRHHRTVQRMRLVIFTLLICFSMAIFVQMWLHPFRESMAAKDPGAFISEQAQADSRLADALAKADQGDKDLFAQYLRQASDKGRLELAISHLRLAEQGSVALGIPANDMTALYARKQRFIALNATTIGDSDAENALDNLTAYVLMAGTSQPLATDLALAKAILPRLERLVSPPRSGDHAIWDTIGCIHFQLGDYRAARNAFTQAKARSRDATSKDIVGPLYDQRIKAASDGLLGDKVVLPLEGIARPQSVPSALPGLLTASAAISSSSRPAQP